MAAACLRAARSFEVFAEEQILRLDPDADLGFVDYNNSRYGTTHVDDYWTKIDIKYSPLDGWSLNKYVRIGCFSVHFTQADETSWAERILADSDTPEGCTAWCNGTQAYYRSPMCRCAYNDTDVPIYERDECSTTTWEIFRQYDYRSQMSQTAYDVARRFLYQLVTVRLPHVTPSVRNYIHALNVFENRPKFDYDTRLDRVVFNAVWDFKKSRLVALSWFPETDASLYFTVVTFNTSSDILVVEQTHEPIKLESVAPEALVSQTTSVDGMCTVDILYGTYYSVIPAFVQESQFVVHAIIAIDIDRKRVLQSVTLPVALMNLQINALTHVLYGAGMDLTGRLAYYELCQAENVTERVGTVVRSIARVTCNTREMSELPPQVKQMYLQSASIDHHYNYAWFTYKEEATARPLILEYHQDDSDYLLWRQDSLPLEAGFTSLIQTAPRIIFVLYPPSLEYAMFNTAGTKIFLQFNTPTLQGAIPQDRDGDEIPDFWREEDRLIRTPCEAILDDFTMAMIPGAMCQWVSDSRLFIEITRDATIMPGDLVRVRANRIYQGQLSPSGVAMFSQPSTDFKPVLLPEYIPTPKADISGFRLVDLCTELLLDGTGSQDYGYRGPFAWSIDGTQPESSEPHMRSVEQILRDAKAEDPYDNPHIIRIPKETLLTNRSYQFSLNVTTLWNASLSDVASLGVYVSPLPVPPIIIFGPTERIQDINRELLIGALIEKTGCLESLPGFAIPERSYAWTGCFADAIEPLYAGIEGCKEWDPEVRGSGGFSGIMSKTLRGAAFGLLPGKRYAFTVQASLTATDGSGVVLNNVATVFVTTSIESLTALVLGGNSFTTPSNLPLVLDMSFGEYGCSGKRRAATPSGLCEDIGGSGGVPDTGELELNFTCTVLATGAPCDLGSSEPAAPDLGTGGDPGLSTGGDPGLGVIGGGVAGGRRLASTEKLEYSACVNATDPDTGNPRTFVFRGQTYNEALNITYGVPATGLKYCMAKVGVIKFQPDLFAPGEYRFDVNGSKTSSGIRRSIDFSIWVTVIEEPAGGLGRTPQTVLTVNSPLPILPSSIFRLQGAVANPQNSTIYTYEWSAYLWSANKDYDPDKALTDPTYDVERYMYIKLSAPIIDFGDEAMVRTPVGVPYLALNPLVMAPNSKYKFRLTVTDTVLLAQGSSNAQSFSEFVFTTGGLPPSGGKLIVDNTTGIGFSTVFRFEMVGWGSEDVPLSYQFSYKRDLSDPYEQPTFMNTAYSLRSFLDTVLPQGSAAADLGVKVTGHVVSVMGVQATSNSIEVFVRPNDNPDLDTNTLDEIRYLDPESSLLYAIMLAQVQEPSNITNDLINESLQIVEAKAFNETLIPDTPDVLSSSAVFLSSLSSTGLRTQQVADDLALLTERAIANDFVSTETTLVSPDTDPGLSLLSAQDALTPGIVTEPTVAGGRRLQARDLIENRESVLQYSHLVLIRQLQSKVGTAVMSDLYPMEVPVNMTVRGLELFLGKDKVIKDGLENVQGKIRTTFAVPTLDYLSEQYGKSLYAYRYMLYKKFPYSFWEIPSRHSLSAPAEDDGAGAQRVPLQGYTNDERLWHAMTLEIDDVNGTPLAEQVQQSLENATFDRLPQIAASGATTMGQYGTLDHAATCYGVGLDGALPHFDSRGITYDRESCVSMALQNFVVLIDDLPKEIDTYELISRGVALAIQEDRPATAAVGALLICIIMGIGAGGFGMYVDGKQHHILGIDVSPVRVVDAPDAQDKLLATIAYAFKRNHLIIGMFHKHRKLTREKRVLVAWVTGLGTQSIATLLHSSSVIRFRATTQFVATGLTAAVLLFPLSVFLQFLYEWRPMTRIHTVAPPRSMAPLPPDRRGERQDIAQPKSLFSPKPPPVVMKARAPPKSAHPRTPFISQLALPVASFKKGDVARPKPPQLPPGKPRPPSTSPPERQPTVPLNGGLGASDRGLRAAASTGPGAFGLALPELPALQQGPRGEGRPPPPKAVKRDVAPAPPKKPPPKGGMFFTAAPTLRMPFGPPPPPVGAKSPSVPPLPSVRSPHEMLSAVQAIAPQALALRGALPEMAPPARQPPPPPMLRPQGEVVPQAPPTPTRALRDAANTTSLGFGFTSSSGAFGATPRGDAERAPEPPVVQDVEVSAPLPSFIPDGSHAMMPPPEYTTPPPAAPAASVVERRPPGRAPEHTGRARPRPPDTRPSGAILARPPALPPSAAPDASTMALAPRPSMPLDVPSPLPMLPVPDAGGQLALPIASHGGLALRNTPGMGHVPPLPKYSLPRLPNAVLANIPAIQRDSGVVVVPPPPPKGGVGELAHLPVPPREGAPTVKQGMVPYKAAPRRGGPPSRLPRPPDKPPSSVPKPPPGPPPGPGMQLAQRPGVRGFDEEAVRAQARPPPAQPKPPPGPPPTHPRAALPGRGPVPAIGPTKVDGIARAAAGAIDGVDDLLRRFRQDPVREVALARQRHDEKAPKPVADYIVSISWGLVTGFAVFNLLAAVAIITFYGTYLPPEAVYPTYAATIVGMVVNMGLFESIKCVVIAAWALVDDGTSARRMTNRGRAIRMMLKRQRPGA